MKFRLRLVGNRGFQNQPCDAGEVLLPMLDLVRTLGHAGIPTDSRAKRQPLGLWVRFGYGDKKTRRAREQLIGQAHAVTPS
jgi:hypothetical protein